MKQLDEFLENAKALPCEICSDVETAIRSVQIKQEIEAGASLSDIIERTLPNLSKDEIKRDVEDLLSGIKDFQDVMDAIADDKWVSQYLNQQMLDLSQKQRITYLNNLIQAEQAIEPEERMLSEDELDILNKITEKEDPTGDDVQIVIGLTNQVISEHSGILLCQSIRGIEKRLYKYDHETVADQIINEAVTAESYAAACYIAQKTGHLRKVYHQDASDISARDLGALAAAGIESSKLMELYSAGRIPMKRLQEKLHKIFKVVLTFISSHLVKAGAVAVHIALMFLVSVALLNVFPPVLAVILTLYLGVAYLSPDDIESVLRSIPGWVAALKEKVEQVINRLRDKVVSKASNVDTVTAETVSEDAETDEKYDEDEEVGLEVEMAFA